jgi:hemolysin III
MRDGSQVLALARRFAAREYGREETGVTMYRLTKEEIANSITHGIGLLLSLTGLALLVVLAILKGTAWHIVSCVVYGVTLVLVYLASTLYHSVPSERTKRILKILDHSAIYLLIAGTYTPFLLVTLRGGWGWTLFGIVWGMALLGIVFKIFFLDRFRAISTTGYVAIGWLAVIAMKPLLAMLPTGGILWLVAGGMAYTLGVAFYSWRRLPYNHAIWHVFVLAGSVCHYVAVLIYVLPVRN